MDHAGLAGVGVIAWIRQLGQKFYTFGRKLVALLLALLLPLGLELAALFQSAQFARSPSPVLDLTPVANLLDAVPPPRSYEVPQADESDRRGPTEQLSGGWQPDVFPFDYPPLVEQTSTIVPGVGLNGFSASAALEPWDTLLPGHNPLHLFDSAG